MADDQHRDSQTPFDDSIDDIDVYDPLDAFSDLEPEPSPPRESSLPTYSKSPFQAPRPLFASDDQVDFFDYLDDNIFDPYTPTDDALPEPWDTPADEPLSDVPLDVPPVIDEPVDALPGTPVDIPPVDSIPLPPVDDVVRSDIVPDKVAPDDIAPEEVAHEEVLPDEIVPDELTTEGVVTFDDKAPEDDEPQPDVTMPVVEQHDNDKPVIHEDAATETEALATATLLSSHRQPGGYRVRGLDGLRAIACIAVLLYHFIPGSTSGGFLGVDVFFVLSGFLITGLLLKEYGITGRINLKAFWIRRMRRLFPAVTFMVLLTVPLATLIHDDLRVGIGKQIFGVLTFSYNWIEIFSGNSYFEQNNPHIFMNVWSLGVEEQFYLTWPLIVIALIAIFGFKRRKVASFIPVLFAGLSIVWMAYLVAQIPLNAFDPTRAYMGTDSHAFGLMLGAALAFFIDRPIMPSTRVLSPFERHLRGVAAWIGLGTVLVSFFVVPDSIPLTYPWLSLIAVVGVLLFLQGCVDDVAGTSGPGRTLVTIVDTPILRWLGVRSYGIYLWHWPLLVLATTLVPDLNTALTATIVAVLSVGIAALSFTYIENPMRKNGIGVTLHQWFNKTAQRRSAWILVPVIFLFVTIPATVYAVVTSSSMTTTQKMLLDAAENKQNALDKGISTLTLAMRETQKDVTGDQVLVIGDSVTLGSKPQIESTLPGIIVNADVSRSILKAAPLIKSYQDKGVNRPYVVVSLATNSAVTMDNIDQIITTIGSKAHLVLVTAYGPPRCTWIPPSNKVLFEAQEKYPSQVRIADWHKAIESKTDLLAPDLTHPSGIDGTTIYAHTLRDGIDSFKKPLKTAKK